MTVQRNKVWHDSISLWQDSLKKDSKNSKAWDMLGVAFYNKKEYINAKNSFIKAKSLNPFEPEVYVHLGELYFRLNKPIKAKQEYIKAININDNYKDAIVGLGFIFYRFPNLIGKSDIRYFHLRLNKDLENPYLNFINGVITFLKSNQKQGIKLIEKAVKLRIDLYQAYDILGDISFKRKDFIKAIEYYRKEYLIVPDSSSPLVNIAACYNGIKKYDRAIKWAKKAILLDKNCWKAYFQMGLAYGEKRDYDKAIFCFKEIERIRSPHPFVIYKLGYFYFKKNDKKRSLYYLQKVKDLPEAKILIEKMKEIK